MTTVAILLATYNGAPYLSDQLNSIDRQTYEDWSLTISDDGSSDATRAIIRGFEESHPNRVTVISGPRSGSAKLNFFFLLRNAPKAPYIALCDQDDVWVEEKLQRLVEVCQLSESVEAAGTPVLVHSDLQVVDESLGPITGSFMADIRADPRTATFGSTLVENCIPGCSVLMNKALLEVHNQYSGDLCDAQMHDWWLALIAHAFGRVVYVAEPLVLYRQHGSNVAGSVSRSGIRFVLRKMTTVRAREVRTCLQQAELFWRAYASELEASERRVLHGFATLPQLSKISRVRTCVRLGILKQTRPRQIHQLLSI